MNRNDNPLIIPLEYFMASFLTVFDKTDSDERSDRFFAFKSRQLGHKKIRFPRIGASHLVVSFHLPPDFRDTDQLLPGYFSRLLRKYPLRKNNREEQAPTPCNRPHPAFQK